MHFEYVFLRLVRRNMPRTIVSFMSERGLMLKRGLETDNPKAAVEQYEEELAKYGTSIRDHVVMNFGYGGFLGTAIELLQRGAKHVYLCDKYAKPNNRKNGKLLEMHGKYLRRVNKDTLPNPDFITITNKDVREVKDLEIDLILSSSVLEHVDEVDSAINALGEITAPDGIHVHFIDLRDHFFKYPFEMLCYSKGNWERFLNPDSNLNRLRIRDYERIFTEHFEDVRCRIVESDLDSYRKAKGRIKPEFVTGDDEIDSTTQIAIIASSPHNKAK